MHISTTYVATMINETIWDLNVAMLDSPSYRRGVTCDNFRNNVSLSPSLYVASACA